MHKLVVTLLVLSTIFLVACQPAIVQSQDDLGHEQVIVGIAIPVLTELHDYPLLPGRLVLLNGSDGKQLYIHRLYRPTDEMHVAFWVGSDELIEIPQDFCLDGGSIEFDLESRYLDRYYQGIQIEYDCVSTLTVSAEGWSGQLKSIDWHRHQGYIEPFELTQKEVAVGVFVRVGESVAVQNPNYNSATYRLFNIDPIGRNRALLGQMVFVDDLGNSFGDIEEYTLNDCTGIDEVQAGHIDAVYYIVDNPKGHFGEVVQSSHCHEVDPHNGEFGIRAREDRGWEITFYPKF